MTVKFVHFFKTKETKRIGSFRSDEGDGNENVIKAIVLISKTTTFHAHPTLFCTFVVFARLRIEDEIFFLFLTLHKALKNSTPGEFAYIRQRKRYGIIAMKFEKPRISSSRH